MTVAANGRVNWAVTIVLAIVMLVVTRVVDRVMASPDEQKVELAAVDKRLVAVESTYPEILRRLQNIENELAEARKARTTK